MKSLHLIFSQGELIGNLDLITGIKLRETQGKQDKKTKSAIPLTTDKQSSYRRAQKTTPIVRRRVPRQLTPTETKSEQVNLGGKCNFSKYQR